MRSREGPGHRGGAGDAAHDGGEQQAASLACHPHRNVSGIADCAHQNGHQPYLVGIERIPGVHGAVGQYRQQHGRHHQQDKRRAQLRPFQPQQKCVQHFPLGQNCSRQHTGGASHRHAAPHRIGAQDEGQKTRNEIRGRAAVGQPGAPPFKKTKWHRESCEAETQCGIAWQQGADAAYCCYQGEGADTGDAPAIAHLARLPPALNADQKANAGGQTDPLQEFNVVHQTVQGGEYAPSRYMSSRMAAPTTTSTTRSPPSRSLVASVRRIKDFRALAEAGPCPRSSLR
jgi:hypothetical protein